MYTELSSGLIGAIITGIVAVIINVYYIKSKSDNTKLMFTLRQRQDEHTQLFKEYNILIANLRDQILDLKKYLLDLRAENLRYITENADLKQQITDLKQQITDLKQQITDLIEANKKLKIHIDSLEVQIKKMLSNSPVFMKD